MSINPFENFLKTFFDEIVTLDQSQSLTQSSLRTSIKNFEKINLDGDTTIAATSLIIGDWTGPNDKGWKINYPTGSMKMLKLEEYSEEVNRLISYECSYLFAQAFERLQGLIKDFISYQLSVDTTYCKKCKVDSNNKFEFYRSHKIKRDDLFKNVKRIFKQDEKNNESTYLKEWWTVLAVCRDAVVHSSNIIKGKDILNWQKPHFVIFHHLFPKSVKSNNDLILQMERKEFSRGIKSIAEFGFQVFKLISIKQNLEWKILENYGLIPSEEREKRKTQQNQKGN